jgi:myo-inositol 2-dehydrogenase/D-chiro-inositol 1-dehydrogenase
VHRQLAAGRTADGPHHFFTERYREAYVAEMRAFLEAVLADRNPPVGGADGLQALRIALAARQSLSERRTVRVEQPGAAAPKAA